MKVNVQSINFNVDQKLINFIQKRMNKLDLKYIYICSPLEIAGFFVCKKH